MIGIKTQSGYLELEPSTKVSLQLNNPLFNEDNLSPGSISFPFDVPLKDSENNVAALKHIDVLEAVGTSNRVDASLFFDLLPYKKGKLIVRGTKDGKASTNFNFGLNTLSDEFKTKKLRDLLNFEISIPKVPGYQSKVLYVKPKTGAPTPYQLKVNNEVFEASNLADLASAINNKLATNGAFAVYYSSGSGSPLGYVTGSYLTLSANLTDSLVPLSVDSVGENTASNWIVEADLRDYYLSFKNWLQSYFSSSGWSTPSPFWFPVVYNDNIKGEKTTDTNGIPGFTVNASINQDVVQNSPNWGLTVGNPLTVLNQNSLQPFLRVGYVLDKIAEYFDITWGGDWIYTSDVQNMLIDNTALLDVYQNFIGKEPFLFWKMSFKLSDLVPDVSVVSFLKALQSRYNLCFYVSDGGKVMVMKKETIAKSMIPFDITSIAGKSKEQVDERVDGFVMVSKKKDYDRIHLRDELKIGGGEQELIVEAGSLQRNTTYTDLFGRTYSAPVVAQKQGDKFDLRIFYYRGIVSNGTFTYAQANVNATLYNEQLSGSNGIYENFWKYWLLYEGKRRIVPLPVRFEFRHLNRLDWARKVRVNQCNYLIKSIKVDLTMQGMKVSEVELATMF